MCGIVGVYSWEQIEMVPILHDMLIMLQHRGHEAAGAVFFTGESEPVYERRLAESGNSVAHFFKKFKREDLKALWAVGHTRYSTAGGVDVIDNAQPILRKTKYGTVAIAHNGTIVRASKIKAELVQTGESFASDSDTEVILSLIARSKKEKLADAVIESLETVGGSYAVLIFSEEGMIAARDPFGFRPLSIAKFNSGYLLASETCSFDPLRKEWGAAFLRDVEPGEVVSFDKYGIKTIKRFPSTKVSPCIFELIYFARPDSHLFGWAVDEFREMTGIKQAGKMGIEADCVIGVPDSANYFADGQAKGLGIANERALVRNHSSGRTFIDPNQKKRSKNVRLKLNPIRSRIEGRRVVVCDDSIVRGNTSKKVISMIRGCNPKSIIFSLGSPPIKYPCFYGIDTPREEDLIAAKITEQQIADFIGADQLFYLPISLLKEIGGPNFCYACFDGEYPLL